MVIFIQGRRNRPLDVDIRSRLLYVQASVQIFHIGKISISGVCFRLALIALRCPEVGYKTLSAARDRIRVR